MTQTWYAFRTAPRKELVAATILERMGLHAFSPKHYRYRRVSRHSKKTVPVEFAIMPGYTLVGVEGSRFPWEKVFSVKRLGTLHSVVGYAGCPIPLLPEAVAYLRSLSEDDPDMPKHNKHYWTVKTGDFVNVTGGPFWGFGAKIDSMTNKEAQITLSIFGRPTTVNIPLDLLEKV